MSDADIRNSEEEKRLQAADPLERWLQLQRAIDWALEAMPPTEWKIQRQLKQRRLQLEKSPPAQSKES